MKRATLAALLSGTFLLSGCVSVTRYNFEEAATPLENSKQFCNYQWPETIKVFTRSRDLFFTSDWQEITSSDHDLFRKNNGDFKTNMQQKCTGASPAKESELDVSVHYLHNVNRAVKALVTIPMFIANIATLFVMPVYDRDYFYLCLDMTISNGSHRYGLAQGDLVVLNNVYGELQDTANGASVSAQLRWGARERNILDQLLIRAFDKAWSADKSGFKHSSCEAALNANID
ncbi:MAG: hypothetical protein PHI29_02205 [Gallionella sp.]|nr:hypothetical protein [Gallionella sp.]